MPINLETILCCPSCRKIIEREHKKNCKLEMRGTFKTKDNIYDLLHAMPKQRSQHLNEELHSHGPWHRIDDGSYEVLAAFARGNKTVDIACGDGYVEELAPQTVGVDFSISALKKARQNGAKYLVCANAENLPFIDNAFDIAVCAGSIENIGNPQKAVLEMARVSKIQIMTIHREFNFPFSRQIRSLATKALGIKHQPVERPLKWTEIDIMLKKAKLEVIFKGLWTLPVNYGKVIPFIPQLTKIPSCFFLISTKQ